MGNKKNQQQKKKQNPTTKNGKSQDHPKQNFLQLIEEASISKVRPFVSAQIQQLGARLKQENVSSFRALYTRIVTLEKFLMDKYDMSDDVWADLVADQEDLAADLKKIEGPAEKGDILRITFSTRSIKQKIFQHEQMLIVENAGIEPFSLGPEIDPHLIGMKAGDIKTVKFGGEDEETKEKPFVARLEVNRVSRSNKPVPPPVEAPKLAESPISEEEIEKISDALGEGCDVSVPECPDEGCKSCEGCEHTEPEVPDAEACDDETNEWLDKKIEENQADLAEETSSDDAIDLSKKVTHENQKPDAERPDTSPKEEDSLENPNAGK